MLDFYHVWKPLMMNAGPLDDIIQRAAEKERLHEDAGYGVDDRTPAGASGQQDDAPRPV